MRRCLNFVFRWITVDMKIYAEHLAELSIFMPTASLATVVAKRDRGSDDVSQNSRRTNSVIVVMGLVV